MSISIARVYWVFGVFGLAACGPAEGTDSAESEVIGSVQEDWHELACIAAATQSVTLPTFWCEHLVRVENKWHDVPYGSPGCPYQFAIEVFGHENKYFQPMAWWSPRPTNQLECELSGYVGTLYGMSGNPALWSRIHKVQYHGVWVDGRCEHQLDSGFTHFPTYPPNRFTRVKISAGAYTVTGPTTFVQRPAAIFVHHNLCFPF